MTDLTTRLAAWYLGRRVQYTATGWAEQVLQATADVRVVVIDPEGREQAARLLAAYTTSVQAPFRAPGEPDDWRTDRMQAALRSLLAPPKPDEPQHLGAVVEDTDGTRWVRTEGLPARVDGSVWASAFSQALPERSVNREYADIDVVRVLAEGIQ